MIFRRTSHPSRDLSSLYGRGVSVEILMIFGAKPPSPPSMLRFAPSAIPSRPASLLSQMHSATDTNKNGRSRRHDDLLILLHIPTSGWLFSSVAPRSLQPSHGPKDFEQLCCMVQCRYVGRNPFHSDTVNLATATAAIAAKNPYLTR